MTDEEYTVFGREQPPAKIYRTCTFEGLGPKKTEFLNRFVKAMEDKGLKKTSPIEPFKLAIGVKHIFSFKIWNEIGRREMVGTDVLLASDKRGTHTRVGLRAETRGNDLRFGYFYCRWHDPRSPAAIKFFAKLIGGIILLCVWCFFVGFVLLGGPRGPFAQAHEITVFLSVFVTLAVLPTIPVVYISYRRETRPKRDLDKLTLDIAESMGGKQITPFKWKTVKLEE